LAAPTKAAGWCRVAVVVGVTNDIEFDGPAAIGDIGGAVENRFACRINDGAAAFELVGAGLRKNGKANVAGICRKRRENESR
jgi:hypothetical protein